MFSRERARNGRGKQNGRSRAGACPLRDSGLPATGMELINLQKTNKKDMKKFTLLAVSAVVFQALLWAGPVSREQARALAYEFYSQSVQAKSPVSVNDFSLAYPSQAKAGDADALCYVFNAGEGQGFVIVSGDDDLRPVLGYSFTGTFKGEDMPANLRYWMGWYEEQVRAYQESVASGSPRLSKGGSFPKADAVEVVPALLENHEDGPINYDQGYPYNELCPDPWDYGWNTYTGCVATALAQIARFYEHPVQGTGSITYEGDLGTFSQDFSQSVYDWDNMLGDYQQNSFTEEQAQAVAVLMRDIGHAVQMNYGYDASGAYDLDALYGMQAYMGFNQETSYCQREYYTDAQWHEIVCAELDAGRPIYYSGASSDGSGGHAFVCDGYNEENFFHFNWGWGSLANGWYSLDNLAPTETGTGAGFGEYNAFQSIFTGFRPSQGETGGGGELLYSGDRDAFLECSKGTYGRSDRLECTAYDFYAYSPTSLPVEFGMGYWQDGLCVDVKNTTNMTLETYYGYREMYFTIFPGSDLDEGVYKLALTARYFDNTEWKEVLAPVGAVRAYKITVTADGFEVSDWTAEDEAGWGGGTLSAIGVESLRTLAANTGNWIKFTGPLKVSAKDAERNQLYLSDSKGLGILVEDSLGVLSSVQEGDIWKDCSVLLRKDEKSFYWIIPQSFTPQESSVSDFSPHPITLAEFLEDSVRYQSALLDFGFVSWSDADSVFEAGETYAFSYGNYSFILRTHFPQADYIGMEVKSGTIGLKGLVTYADGQYAVTPRTKADLVLEFPEVVDLKAEVDSSTVVLTWSVDSSSSILPDRFRVYVDSTYKGIVTQLTYLISGLEDGMHVAEVSAIYNGGQIESARALVEFEIKTAEIDSASNREEMRLSCRIYPNPFSGTFHFEASAAGEFSLMALDGKVLLRRRIPALGTYEMDASGLLPGVYVTRFESEGRVWNGKIVKR